MSCVRLTADAIDPAVSAGGTAVGPAVVIAAARTSRDPAQHGHHRERSGAEGLRRAGRRDRRGRDGGHARDLVSLDRRPGQPVAHHAEREQRQGALAQRGAGPEDQLAHARARVPEARRDLLVAIPLELAQRQRLTLGVRQPAHPGDQAAQLFLLLQQRRRLWHAVELEVELLVLPRPHPDLVDGAVVRDPVQPRAQRDLARSAVAQREEGLQQSLLDRVLGALGADQARAVDTQRHAGSGA